MFDDFYEAHKDRVVTTSPGVSYSLTDVMIENRRLHHSKFEDPNSLSGMDKLFFNIGYINYNAMYQHTDVDTKNLEVTGIGQIGREFAPLFRRGLQHELNKTRAEAFFNKVRSMLLVDGVVYVKLVGNRPYVVDPLNIIEPADREGLGTQGEKIYLSPVEATAYLATFEDLKDEDSAVLESARETIEKVKEDGSSVCFVEYWEIGEDFKKSKCTFLIDTKPIEPKNDKSQDWTRFKEVGYIDNVKFPYKKAHSILVANRAIGFSSYELSKGIIQNYNEIMNLAREKSLLDLRGLFIFKQGYNNRTVPQSFANKLGTGGFLITEPGEEIERLPYQYLAGEVLTSANQLFDHARKLSGTTDLDTGGKLPSRVSATATQYSQQNADTTYSIIRENLSILLTDFMEDLWAEAMLEDLQKEDFVSLSFSPKELKQMDTYLATQQIYKELNDSKKSFGYFAVDDGLTPIETESQIQVLIENKVAGQDGVTRDISFSKGMVNAMKFNIRITLDDSKMEKARLIQDLLLQLQNAQDPITAGKINAEIANLNGLDPSIFELTAEEKKQIMEMQGGQQEKAPQQPQRGLPAN